MADLLRTPETAAKAKLHRESRKANDDCELCAKPALQTFEHWKVTEVLFPYDLVASTHHMIMPIRHIVESELTPEEIAEYKEIKSTFIQDYDSIIEGTKRTKSIPAHFHLHLIVKK